MAPAMSSNPTTAAMMPMTIFLVTGPPEDASAVDEALVAAGVVVVTVEVTGAAAGAMIAVGVPSVQFA